jgi:spore maturation protein CgeB
MMGQVPIRHRNYRVVGVSSLGYSQAAEVLYRDDPALRCCSFAEQRRSWLAEKVGHGDSLSRAMKSLGNEAEEIICDLETLQRTWAWERGVEVDEKRWRTQLVLEQIADLKPEVVYLHGYEVLPYSVRRDLKVRFPFVELLVIAQEAIVPTQKVIRELATADVLLVSSLPLHRKCRDVGLSSHLVHSCFDPSVLSQLPAPSRIAEVPGFDFTFAGASGYSAGHRRRYGALLELMQRTDLECWSTDDPRVLKGRTANRTRRVRSSEMDPSRCHPPVFGLDYYKVLQRSKITFNCHRDAARGGVDNHRMFQATGVGTCLITDRDANLPELFEDGKEVVTYDCMDDCIEKVEYLLEHDDERSEIAAAGRRRTLADHSSRKRYAAIDEIIQQALAGHRKDVRARWRGLSGSVGF